MSATNHSGGQDTTIRFESLDSLRGVAALAVAIGHFGVLYAYGTTFYLAVDFFLILSGFVLTHSYFSRPVISPSQFAWRRFCRMYPLHLVTLMPWMVVALFSENSLTAVNLMLHILFIQNMGMGPNPLAFNISSWTISVEFWINVTFYFIFHKLFVMDRRESALQKNLCLLLFSSSAIVLISTSGRGLAVGLDNYFGIINSGLLRCAASFACGVFLYDMYMKGRFSPSVLCEILAITAFAVSIFGSFFLGTASFLAIPVFMCVILVFASDHGIIGRGMAKFRFLGDISFSIYMLHFPIFVALKKASPSFGFNMQDLLVYLTLVLLISTLCYKFIEMPIYRAGSALFPSPKPTLPRRGNEDSF